MKTNKEIVSKNSIVAGAEYGATFSLCGQYRYKLWRKWSEGARVIFIYLNPSTADETKNDPTIRRLSGFAKRQGAGSVYALNLFAYRATLPRDLFATPDPVGPLNDKAFKKNVWKDGATNKTRHTVIAGWGNYGRHGGRSRQVATMLESEDVYCLGINKTGEPVHPLYVPYKKRLIAFTGM